VGKREEGKQGGLQLSLQAKVSEMSAELVRAFEEKEK
jgi:hypothetical protein